jgi:hypothetical protein
MMSTPNRPLGQRPRAKTLVQLDLYNAYARLGVSPLLSTEEIKAAVLRLRKDLMRRRRTRSQQEFGKEEAEITELQAIEDEIGTPKARARYDQANPQNELLTVQPSPSDRYLDPKRRSWLVTSWLVEELGREALLPSPESLALWAVGGLSPELTAFLTEFADDARAGAAETAPISLPNVHELQALTGASTDSPTPPSREEATHG